MEIKCVEGYGNTFLFFPSRFWIAETAPEAPKSSELRQERRCSPLGSFCGEKAAMAKAVREMRGERAPAGNVSPAEMLIAKQSREVSERSVCFKTTKKLLKNDMISGVFLPEKLPKRCSCDEACCEASELSSALPKQRSRAGSQRRKGSWRGDGFKGQNCALVLVRRRTGFTEYTTLQIPISYAFRLQQFLCTSLKAKQSKSLDSLVSISFFWHIVHHLYIFMLEAKMESLLLMASSQSSV